MRVGQILKAQRKLRKFGSPKFSSKRQMAARRFDINRSLDPPGALAFFLASAVNSDLTSVPGIGDASVTALREQGITTTHQLIGQFLLLKGENTTWTEHLDAMYNWLTLVGTEIGSRSRVVHCIAEKCTIMIPSLSVIPERD